MRTILCYGDSNTWGYVPGTAERHPPQVRWTGVLAARLGPDTRVVEEGLNGRTTAWDEPFRPGRNGLAWIGPLLESHAPLDLVVLMLGTNDLKHFHAATAADSARGAAAILARVRHSTAGTGGGAPPVLLVAPPRIGPLSAQLALQFEGAAAKSAGFGLRYREVAQAEGCAFLDAGAVVEPGEADGVHLDACAHARLAAAIEEAARPVLAGHAPA